MVTELGKSTRDSSTHVVSSGGFTEPFEETDKQNDLPLSSKGKCIPLFRWGAGSRREWRSISGNGPREVNSVGLDNVTYNIGSK